MEVSKLVSDLKQKLQHEEEGVGPVVGAGRWGGGNRHLGRDTWLWGAEQGWLGQEALRREDVVCVLWVALGCLTSLLHLTLFVRHGWRRPVSAPPLYLLVQQV